MDGAVIVNKEKDFTSFDVVAKMRGICGTKKIGHTGTLDPQAEGVLVLCIGKGTKAVESLSDHDKTYKAGMLLGKTTDTEDIWGETITELANDDERLVTLTEDKVRETIMRFVGDIMQRPPAYSALKINGKKSYELARKGQAVEHEARPVSILNIEITKIEIPHVEFTVSCSKGTYVRSLCRDIGEALGCGACMSSLFRTRVGQFDVQNARTLTELQQMKDAGTLETALISLGELFADIPETSVKAEFQKMLDNGNKINTDMLEPVELECSDGAQLRVNNSDGSFKAIYKYVRKEKCFKPFKMF